MTIELYRICREKNLFLSIVIYVPTDLPHRWEWESTFSATDLVVTVVQDFSAGCVPHGVDEAAWLRGNESCRVPKPLSVVEHSLLRVESKDLRPGTWLGL